MTSCRHDLGGMHQNSMEGYETTSWDGFSMSSDAEDDPPHASKRTKLNDDTSSNTDTASALLESLDKPKGIHGPRYERPR